MLKKIILSIVSIFTFIAIAVACTNNGPLPTNNELAAKIDKTKLKKAVFASGCFWCVEAIFESVRGVEESYSGYAGGHTLNPTYSSSNTGKTGHAEAVEVWYDSTKVNFKTLVDVYYASQNIEQVNGQGNDRGSQYRSIIFYQNDAEKAIIDAKIAALTQEGYKVASEVKKLVKFWMGEDYHQDYERLHPNQPYIKSVSVPRLNKFKAKMPEVLKKTSH
ncbi:MAG: peptide-methionine (S)-S-oxide reductase MsrA [Crocinitomicaceae bacterium]